MAIHYINQALPKSLVNQQSRKEELIILRIQAVPSLSLVFMGSLDWLTTIIGITYFGAIEGNPFLADITGTSLTAFTAVKLSTTIIIGLMFYKAEKTLKKSADSTTRSFKCVHIMLRSAYIIATAFLLIAVLNNIAVVVNTL